MSHYCEVETGARLHYLIDDFTDPWRTPETILMLHGNAESAEAWRAWVPYLARDYRVVRMDLRGFGKSTPMPREFAWSMEILMRDIECLLAHLGCERAHLIGAKSGGSMVLQFAAGRPSRVRSVIAVTPPVVAAGRVRESLEQIERDGVPAWARKSMGGRLGSKITDAELDYWVENIQGKTAQSTLQGYLRWVPGLDIRAEVLKITCPTLIITTTGNGLRSVDSVREWQQKLPRSELVVLEGDAWHAAGAYPDACAREAARFLRQPGS